MTAASAASAASPTTERANAFVAAHLDDARALGPRLAGAIQDPEAFTRLLQDGLRRLADPEYRAGQHSVAPGLGATHGVRSPLLAAIGRAFAHETRDDRPTALLYLADRLYREPEREVLWFAFGLLERTLATEPERTWQLLRRAGREATEWITIDSLARPYALGVLAESYRWAELEQLVYSPSRWERRLVGSTIATIPHADRRAGRTPEVAARSLALVGLLIGDSEPDVQKALSWAYRAMAAVDGPATTAALARETDTAEHTVDGHRAWVIRDSLSKIEPATGASLRARLDGIRRSRTTASTSVAAELVDRFGDLPDPASQPEPPLD